MTSLTLAPSDSIGGLRPPIDVTSDEMAARVRDRYKAETRFRLFGLAAIAFAGLFLILLLGKIVLTGWPAFVHHRATLSVVLAPDVLDVPAGSTGEALARANFAAPLQKSLQTLFPDVTDRAARRQLNGLLSTGASDVVRDDLIAHPEHLGQTLPFPALLSSNADLYLKGHVTHLTTQPGQAVLTPSGTRGDVRLIAGGNVFSSQVGEIKLRLEQRAQALTLQIQRLSTDISRYETLAQNAQNAVISATSTNTSRTRVDADALKANADLQALTRQRTELVAEADDLYKRARAVSGDVVLDTTTPSLLVDINGGVVKVSRLSADGLEGKTLIPLQSEANAASGQWSMRTIESPEAGRRVTDQDIVWLEKLKSTGAVHNTFHTTFLTAGASREPELAGVMAALVGSALTMLITLIISLPLGVGAAIYLEEFAPKNRLTEIVEVNINNLAAVPSIIFGLLGLSVFLNVFGMPRSSAVVGGLVLALLVLPTIIIASRAALRAVPPSIREAALGIGASHQQAVFHHVLPLAMPGIMTGTVIGMAHALGETAPLLMIGMVAFIVDTPQGLADAATVLPVQIYQWSAFPEASFQAKTAGGIMVLLMFLFVMNGLALFLRRRFERRW